ncbi:hypothetical protein BLOT_014185 [Blomia tropicalis]|nr:hypothetical protein BLOT_014185 [Blomia tropicalis]
MEKTNGETKWRKQMEKTNGEEEKKQVVWKMKKGHPSGNDRHPSGIDSHPNLMFMIKSRSSPSSQKH